MNVSDFIQWIVVARRHPLSVLCAVICLLCVIGCWYIHGNMVWLELEHKQVSQDADLAQSSLLSGPSVKQERLAALAITRQIEDNLVVEDNLAENLQYFYKIEDRTKAHVLELRPLNAVVSSSRSLFKRVPFTIRVSGTYEQVVGFLYAIETGPRLAAVTSVNIRRRDPTSLSLILDMNLDMLGRR